MFNPVKIRNLMGGLFVLLVGGCGGGGGIGAGSTGPSPNSPQVTVAWPVRTRSISAPNSALSCKFTLQLGVQNPSYSITGNRPSALNANTATYRMNGTAPAGSYTLTGVFYSEAGESGVVVGTVSSPVSLQSNGTLLTLTGQPLQLTFTGTIKSVAVNPNQSVAVGKSTTLTATAFDVTGSPIVITQGSFNFAISGSAADLQVSANGAAVGLAAGSPLVTVSVDGVTSAPETVIVGPSSPTYDSYVISANDIAYDKSRNLIYAACTAQSPTYAGQVAVVNVGTNEFESSFPTTNSPAHLATSNDGNYLYVAGNDGTIQRVNLTTNLIDATIKLPSGTVPNQILAIPGLPETFAVSLASSADGVTDQGTAILDGITFRTGIAKIGLSIDANSTGSRIYGFQVYKTSGALYSSANIGATGISGVQSEVTVIQGSGNRIHWDDNKIISDSGAVINADSGATIGQFPVPPSSTLAVPVLGTDVVYFLSASPYEIGKYSLSTLSNNFSAQISGPSGYPNRAISLGSNRIGFHTAYGNPSAVYALVGLP